VKTLYRRLVADAATGQLVVTIPSGAVIRRVHVNVFTLPFVALGTADTATVLVRNGSIVQYDNPNDSTWLFGQETVQAYQPLTWQGKIRLDYQGACYVDFEGATVGNQLELAVMID
jgi:hypothetical protein